MLKNLIFSVFFTLVSSSALAVAPSAEAPDLELFITGSSAVDNALKTLIANKLCVWGTADYYSAGYNHWAYYCAVDRTQIIGGFPSWNASHPGVNPKILFHKRSAGGSVMGVLPLQENKTLDHLNIWNTVYNSSNCTLVGDHKWSCTQINPGDILTTYADLGVSDVNPEMFVGSNVATGFLPFNSQVYNLNIQYSAAEVFGITVSQNLYRALQKVQGLDVGSENQANMPNLNKVQIASLMSGVIKKWDQIMVNGVPLTSANSITSPASNKVTICRYTRGSGVQAQFMANFLNYPCTATTFSAIEAPGNGLSGPIVIESSSVEYAARCLDDANRANNWAIGLQATENNVHNELGYRFVKVDGAAPTIQNAATGNYFDWAEQTWLMQSVGSRVLSGDKLNLANTIINDFSLPSIISTVMNPNFLYSWGQGGYLATKSNGYVADFPFVVSNPVIPFVHYFAGGLPDGCRVPVIASGNMNM